VDIVTAQSNSGIQGLIVKLYIQSESGNIEDLKGLTIKEKITWEANGWERCYLILRRMPKPWDRCELQKAAAKEGSIWRFDDKLKFVIEPNLNRAWFGDRHEYAAGTEFKTPQSEWGQLPPSVVVKRHQLFIWQLPEMTEWVVLPLAVNNFSNPGAVVRTFYRQGNNHRLRIEIGTGGNWVWDKLVP
jgi:hypothetical protein